MNVERQTYSVPGFCAAFGISRAHFYRLLKDGRGPAVIRLGRRTLISVKAAQQWCSQMERGNH
jgi:predicted DNA-binding transcriptional regulator AlpA